MNAKLAGFSVHVVDIAAGEPAAGMVIDFDVLGNGNGNDNENSITPVASGLITNSEGKLLFDSMSGYQILRGRYRITLHLARYYRDTGRSIEKPFIEKLPFDFGIADPTVHHHLPAKVTPWGMSLFLTR